VLSVLALAAGTLPFAVVGSVPLLTVAVFVAGLAISPMVISGFGLVEAAMPPARLTEGLTMAGTALGLGAAVGAAAAGPVIDAHDASRAFLVTCSFGGAAAVTVAVAGRTLLRQEARA
jgi:predicted MFS family arabinose efflux permease